jgi:cell division protein FtsB
MKYGNRPLWKSLFYSPIGILIGIIVLILLIRGGLSIHQKAIIAGIRLDQTKAELADLQKQQQSLTNSISQLSTPDGIEAALREKYHAVKQGESVAVIVDNSTQVNSAQNNNYSMTDNSNIETTTKLSWWSSFLHLFGF